MNTRPSASTRSLAPVKMSARFRFFFRYGLILCLVFGTALGGVNCTSGGGGSPCDGKQHEFGLNQQNGGVVAQAPAGGGPLPFVATFPYPQLPWPCTSHLNAWKNTNNFRIGLITPGHNSSECFKDPEAVIVLEPNTSTSADNLTKLYGQDKPAMSAAKPIQAGFCAEAGVNVSVVGITAVYTLDK